MHDACPEYKCGMINDLCPDDQSRSVCVQGTSSSLTENIPITTNIGQIQEQNSYFLYLIKCQNMYINIVICELPPHKTSVK